MKTIHLQENTLQRGHTTSYIIAKGNKPKEGIGNQTTYHPIMMTRLAQTHKTCLSNWVQRIIYSSH
jgi:hypothetical protein